jgi:hypothetical protein
LTYQDNREGLRMLPLNPMEYVESHRAGGKSLTASKL